MKETKEEKKQVQSEQEFHKTAFGKLTGITLIATCIILAVGIAIMGFEAVCYANNLDVEKYSHLFTLGNIFITFSLIGSLGCSSIYAIFVPKATSGKGEKKSTKINSNEFEYLKLGITIIIGTWYVSLFYYIGYSIGLLIS